MAVIEVMAEILHVGFQSLFLFSGPRGSLGLPKDHSVLEFCFRPKLGGQSRVFQTDLPIKRTFVNTDSLALAQTTRNRTLCKIYAFQGRGGDGCRSLGATEGVEQPTAHPSTDSLEQKGVTN